MSAEPRIPTHRFYQKQKHAKLAREDKNKRFILPSGIARIDGGATPLPPTTEGPFDGRDWQDLPAGGTFCDLTAYGWFSVSRFQYLFQFRTPRGPVDDRGRYTFRLEEDGELATTFAFRPDQLPTTVESSFQSIRPNTSRLTVTTNNGDVILFDVRVPIFTGPGQFAPPGFAPAVRTPPDLDLSPDNNTLLYTPGVWAGELAPTVTARLFVDDADTAPAVPSMPVDPAWRGKECGVREAATNAAGGPVFALSPEVLPPALPPPVDPEDALVAFLAGRLAYGLDATDRATMFTDSAGTVPVSADGQPVGRIVTKFKPASPVVEDFVQPTAANKPLAGPGYVAGDGVDDHLAYNQGGTGNFAIFQNLRGFVASIRVTPVAPLAAEDYFATGVGGTGSNFRLRIRGLADGRVQFSGQNQQNSPPVSVTTTAPVLVAGVPITLTLAVDHDAKVLKGYVNGVEAGSLALPLTVSPFTYDINRVRLMQGHGNTISGISDARIHRLLILHDKADAAGVAVIEAWLNEAA